MINKDLRPENSPRSYLEQREYATAVSFLLSEKILELEAMQKRVEEILAPIGGALNDSTVQSFTSLINDLQEQVIDVNTQFGL